MHIKQLWFIFSLEQHVLWLYLMAPRVGLPCVFVVFSDHTHLTFRLLSYKEHLLFQEKSFHIITSVFIPVDMVSENFIFR